MFLAAVADMYHLSSQIQSDMFYVIYVIQVEKNLSSQTGLNSSPEYYLFCDVEGLAVGLLVKPHAAKRLSNNRVVRLLQPLRINHEHDFKA